MDHHDYSSTRPPSMHFHPPLSHDKNNPRTAPDIPTHTHTHTFLPLHFPDTNPKSVWKFPLAQCWHGNNHLGTPRQEAAYATLAALTYGQQAHKDHSVWIMKYTTCTLTLTLCKGGKKKKNLRTHGKDWFLGVWVSDLPHYTKGNKNVTFKKWFFHESILRNHSSPKSADQLTTHHIKPLPWT